MAECKHEFIGGADGVTCKKCDLHLSPDEYRKYLKPKPAQEEKPAPKPKTTKKKAE